jgi:uncharacterized protein
MELTDAVRIPLPPSAVREALCDGAILRASLDNCESHTRLPSGEHVLVMTVPVGPLRGRYDIRVHAANAGGRSSAEGAKPSRCTLNFRAWAAGVGSLRGQVEIGVEEDALGAHVGAHGASDEANHEANHEAYDEVEKWGGHAARIEYAVWATLIGPIAGLPPRQVEGALQALAEDFFAEFASVVEAKHGKGPNRTRTHTSRRQHVFLRPINLAGLAREPAAHDASETAARRADDTLMDQRGPHGLDRQAPQAMLAWGWAAAFAVGGALLYILHRFE